MTTGPSWLVDSKRIASKIKNASEIVDPSSFKWRSNPSKACPKCNHIIDNSDVVQAWPGLPKGVKFDPTDQELLWHLLAKVGKEGTKPHPFINEFIPTVDEEDGICYTHPQKLPGVKQDGSVSHFFHRTFKAYSTGTRKRRKINNDDGDVRWHKTGKTKPVVIDGVHLGCKKIMVLYMSTKKGGKAEKTNWVMHQYHLGTGEDEKDGEFVVSKISYQQQSKPVGKNGQDMEIIDAIIEVEPVAAPESVITQDAKAKSPNGSPRHISDNLEVCQETSSEVICAHPELEKACSQDSQPPTEDAKWWEGESQFLLDSQQLAEGMAICDEFLHSQSSCGGDEAKCSKSLLSDYAHMDVEEFKKDLEACKNLTTHIDHANTDFDTPPEFKDLEACKNLTTHIDHANTDFDTPPDMRLSQLEFGSQDSFPAWGGAKLA